MKMSKQQRREEQEKEQEQEREQLGGGTVDEEKGAVAAEGLPGAKEEKL
jgi:hypothetical protein